MVYIATTNERGRALRAAMTQRVSDCRTLCWCKLHVSEEAVPYQRRACALTTAPTALRSSSSGNYRHQSEAQLCWRTRTLPNLLQPPARPSVRPRLVDLTNTHYPPEKGALGADSRQQDKGWMKEYRIYRTGTSWSTQISWGE